MERTRFGVVLFRLVRINVPDAKPDVMLLSSLVLPVEQSEDHRRPPLLNLDPSEALIHDDDPIIHLGSETLAATPSE